MVKRKIIKIDEEKCTGCGACVPNCMEGALQMIDGKARLISDLFCDGLGACIGHCPEDAIEIEERETVAYDEREVIEQNIVPKGKNTILAHLNHLKEHGADEFLREALDYLKEKDIEVDFMKKEKKQEKCDVPSGCPGSRMMDFSEEEGKADEGAGDESGKRPSELRQWPVQMHLISPMAPYYKGKDVVIAADCAGFSLPDFHKDYLKARSLAIACPKLDSEQEIYVDKIKSLIDDARVNTLTVMIMQVPCCGGLLHLVKEAASQATRKVPIKRIVVGIKGEILEEDWV